MKTIVNRVMLLMLSFLLLSNELPLYGMQRRASWKQENGNTISTKNTPDDFTPYTEIYEPAHHEQDRSNLQFQKKPEDINPVQELKAALDRNDLDSARIILGIVRDMLSREYKRSNAEQVRQYKEKLKASIYEVFVSALLASITHHSREKEQVGCFAITEGKVDVLHVIKSNDAWYEGRKTRIVHLAALHGKGDIMKACLQQLRVKGINLNAIVDAHEEGLLHYTWKNRQLIQQSIGPVWMTQLLVDNGCLNNPSTYGITPIAQVAIALDACNLSGFPLGLEAILEQLERKTAQASTAKEDTSPIDELAQLTITSPIDRDCPTTAATMTSPTNQRPSTVAHAITQGQSPSGSPLFDASFQSPTGPESQKSFLPVHAVQPTNYRAC